MYNYLLFLSVSLAISYLFFLSIRENNILKKIISIPNERSSHKKSIPQYGGIGILCGFIGSIVFLNLFTNTIIDKNMILIGIFSIIMLLIGVVDDIFEIKAKTKLVIDIVIAFAFIETSGFKIDNFYGIFGYDELKSFPSYVLSISTFIVIRNSYNLIDGIDGLAGFIGIFILATFSFIFFQLGNINFIIICLSAIGSILAFTKFNYNKKHKKTFLGNNGTMLIGFILAALTLAAFENNQKNNFLFEKLPIIMFSIFNYQFLDTLNVFITRIIRKTNPFKADKLHLHHLVNNKINNHFTSSLYLLIFSTANFLIVYNLFLLKNITISFFASLLTVTIITRLMILLIKKL